MIGLTNGVHMDILNFKMSTDSIHELESLFSKIRSSHGPKKPDEVKDLTNFFRYNSMLFTATSELPNSKPKHNSSASFHQSSLYEDYLKYSNPSISMTECKAYFNCCDEMEDHHEKNELSEFASNETLVDKGKTSILVKDGISAKKGGIGSKMKKWMRSLKSSMFHKSAK
jgi:hypothetical protein